MTLRSLSEQELFDGYVREIKDLEKKMTIGMRLSPSQAMALVGVLQLAFRHPRLKGPAREIAGQIVASIQSEFLQYDAPHVIELIRRGESKDYDMEEKC